MDAYDFIGAREKLPMAVRSLPDNYKKQNAIALMAVIEELRNSYRVEMKVIWAFSGLDVTDRDAVTNLASYIRKYHQFRDFDTERTHCHNIDRIVCELLKRYDTGVRADQQRIEDLQKVLNPLRNADNDLLDDLEPLVDDALQTISEIEAAVAPTAGAPNTGKAREVQRSFVQRMSKRQDEVKATLSTLNRLSNELIDLA